MSKFLSASVTLALAAPLLAAADTPPAAPAEIKALKQDIEALRSAYEARLQALEQRLLAAETNSTARSQTSTASSSALPPSASSAGGANAFNPEISLILSGGYTRTLRDPANYRVTGFQAPANGEAGPGTRGFSLAESELRLAANIDPYLRGAATLSLGSDNTVSVEEAFVQTTSLGNGLSVKAGRFLSSIGYLNRQHAHTWDFVDNPLAYQTLLGTQYRDDGLQLSWLAPTDRYLELGAEVGRGRSFPGSDTSRNGAGMVALTAHTGGDVGVSHSWRAGLSRLSTRASEQNLTAQDSSGSLVNNVFSGKTNIWIVDGVWKWAPNGNATQTSFKLQGEYLRSKRSGTLTYDTENANIGDAYTAVQSGWYVQGVYQFMPRWRLGLRTERLNAGSPDFGINTAALASNPYRPSKNTLMIDYNPSEFSRLRLQLAQDRSRQGMVDNQIFLQYQMSLGAHGGHNY